MKRLIMTISVVGSLAFAAPALAQQNFTGQPSGDWNANWGFADPNARQQVLNQAIAIEQQENGGFSVRYTYHTYCDAGDSPESGGCNTTIEHQENDYWGGQTSVVGAITEVNGSNNDLGNLTNTNNGGVSGETNTQNNGNQPGDDANFTLLPPYNSQY